MLSHVPPSFFVTHTLPSSVPANSTPGRSGDSASDTIVQYVSAPVTSGVTPPVVRVLTRILMESLVVRSGEIEYKSDRKSTRLNSSHGYISYAVFCLKKKKMTHPTTMTSRTILDT